MPDITMCKGGDCPKKEICYRYKAVPSGRQSYFMSPPIKNGECDHYWEAVSKSQMRRLDHQVNKPKKA